MAIIINPYLLPRLEGGDSGGDIIVPTAFYLGGTVVNAPTVTSYPNVLTKVGTTKVYGSFTLASAGTITIQSTNPSVKVTYNGTAGTTYVAAAQVIAYNATSHKTQLWLYESDADGNLTQVGSVTSGSSQAGVASAQSKTVTGAFDQYLP